MPSLQSSGAASRDHSGFIPHGQKCGDCKHFISRTNWCVVRNKETTSDHLCREPAKEENARNLTSGALPATSDEGSPMPGSQHTDRFSNGYDLEVEEAATHHYPRVAEVEKPAKSWWDLVTSEWRVISAFLVPLFVGGGIFLLPASKSQVDAVKTEAASNLEVAKTDIQGQIKGVHIEIDAVKGSVGDLRSDVKEIGRDLKVLLSRSQPPQQVDAAPVAASPPASPAPAPSQTSSPAKPHKASAKRPQPVVQSSSWSLFSR